LTNQRGKAIQIKRSTPIIKINPAPIKETKRGKICSQQHLYKEIKLLPVTASKKGVQRLN